MNTVELLTKARKLLSEKFKQGDLADSYGYYCALGAVNQIAHVDQRYYLPIRNGTPAERAVFFLENAISGEVPNQPGYTVDNYRFDVIEVVSRGLWKWKWRILPREQQSRTASANWPRRNAPCGSLLSGRLKRRSKLRPDWA